MLCRAQQPLDGNDWGQRNGVAVICFKSRARERSQIKGKRSRRRAPDIWEATGKKGQQVTPMIKSYIFFAFLDSASFSSTSMRQPIPWQCNSLTISIHSSIFLFSLSLPLRSKREWFNCSGDARRWKAKSRCALCARDGTFSLLTALTLRCLWLITSIHQAEGPRLFSPLFSNPLFQFSPGVIPGNTKATQSNQKFISRDALDSITMRSVIRVGPLVSKAEMFLLHGCCISLQTKETRTRFKKIRAKIQNYKRRTSPQTKCAAEYVIFIRYYGKKKRETCLYNSE